MAVNANKIKLQSLDSIFGEATVSEKQSIDIDDLQAFKNHPFKVIEDDKMQDLIESIKRNGVLTPIIVRPTTENKYEIISGHRRSHASKVAGLKEIPAIIKNLNDDEAIIEMVDGNIQREEILPSEKAFAYKLKQDALKHQGSTGGNTNETIGKEQGDSGRQVQRYIRLTYLIPELLELVDNKSIKLIPAVELSYLSGAAQKQLAMVIDDTLKYPSLEQTKQIRSLEIIDYRSIINILGDKPKKKTSISFSLDNEKFKTFFTGKTKKEIQELVANIVETHFQNLKKEN